MSTRSRAVKSAARSVASVYFDSATLRTKGLRAVPSDRDRAIFSIRAREDNTLASAVSAYFVTRDAALADSSALPTTIVAKTS